MVMAVGLSFTSALVCIIKEKIQLSVLSWLRSAVLNTCTGRGTKTNSSGFAAEGTAA